MQKPAVIVKQHVEIIRSGFNTTSPSHATFKRACFAFPRRGNTGSQVTWGQERLRLSVAAHGSSNEVAHTCKGGTAGSACGVSAQTIAAAVSVEIFTLFNLVVRAGRRTRLQRMGGDQVRGANAKSHPGPSTSCRKQESGDHRKRDRGTRRGSSCL